MVKNIRKSIAVVAVVAMLVLTTMTATVSAVSPRGDSGSWEIELISSTSKTVPGVAKGLQQGKDTGVTFYCDGISGNISAVCTVDDSSLCKYQGDYVYLDYLGDKGTVLFNDDWYLHSDGDVAFTVKATGTVGSSISGYGY